MTRIKICGVTGFENALACADAGIDLLGLNFYKRSPRYIVPDDARKLCAGLRGQLGEACPVLVGVFVNDGVGAISEVTNYVGLDFAQLSGDESDAVLAELRGIAYKAIRPMNQVMALDDVRYYSPFFPVDERVPSLLLDAYHPELYGGTGEQASTDVGLAVGAVVPRLMLAGGLKPDNVAQRVRAIRPWGVDVASGVEPPDSVGDKDLAKVRDFIAAVREVDG